MRINKCHFSKNIAASLLSIICPSYLLLEIEWKGGKASREGGGGGGEKERNRRKAEGARGGNNRVRRTRAAGVGGCETEICTNLRLLVMSGDKLHRQKESGFGGLGTRLERWKDEREKESEG